MSDSEQIKKIAEKLIILSNEKMSKEELSDIRKIVKMMQELAFKIEEREKGE